MEDIIVPIGVVGMLFIGLPWMILHYLTKWKSGRGISQQDEMLLDDLHEMARRLDGRLESIERIIAAENPDWKVGRIADLSTGPDAPADILKRRELR
jgi:phage shock protein B